MPVHRRRFRIEEAFMGDNPIASAADGDGDATHHEIMSELRAIREQMERPGISVTTQTIGASVSREMADGYVETYMFGDGFEVHSLLGDLWILFGVAGLLLGLAILAFTVLGMARAVSLGAASAAMLFLSIRVCWDFGFSPFPSAMDTLMLALAVVLPLAPRHRRGE